MIIGAFGLILFLFAPAVQADWTPAKRLTWTPAYAFEPAIAVDSTDAIHVVWSENQVGNSEIYYKKSPDGGTTWNALKRLTWTSGNSFNPSMAIDSGDIIHIVWGDWTPGEEQIYTKKSTDGGKTWSAAKRLTWTSGESLRPAITADSGDGIHVVWFNNLSTSAEVYYKGSTDGGASWSAAQRLTWTGGYSKFPALVADSSNTIHVVWQNFILDPPEIYYKRSTNSGADWSVLKRLTWTSGISSSPAIAADSGGAIHVVWFDDTPGLEKIYYRRSPDGGASWDTVKRLAWTSGESSYPAIAVDSGDAIHVAWHDDAPGNQEIYYKKSTDGGTTWSSALRLSWLSGYSNYAAIATDSARTVHLVWKDDTPGNIEIYYKSGN
jgi:hypothetical protein